MRTTVESSPERVDQYDVLLARATAVLDGRPSARVLDLGPGVGAAHYHPRLRALAGSLVGIDPDPAVEQNPYLDEFRVGFPDAHAAEFRDAFDLVTAVYVIEHVDDPLAFTRSLYEMLAPGGTLLALTPHLWHYFGLTTKVTHALHVDELLVERVRGRDLVEEYHFPVRYRMNSVRRLELAAGAAGFSELRVRLMEDPGVFEPYFPVALRSLPTRYAALVDRLALPGARGTMLIELIKPGEIDP